jgi:drug/metabolite transporter (DMT)-like permease
MEEYKKFGSSDILMLSAILFWAVNFSFIKIALREFTPLGFNGIRLTLASLFLLLFLFVRKEGLPMNRADLWKLVFLGVVGNTVYQLLFIHGLNQTTASNTAIIIALTPIFIALLSIWMKHERLGWSAWLGILISFVGFYLVISVRPDALRFSSRGLAGDFMILIGCVVWATYTVFSKPLLERITPLQLTTITMVIGTVFYLPFCVRDIMRTPYASLSLAAWASLVYSALFALAICYLIWYISVKRVGNSKTAIYDYLVPIFSIFFAYIFLDERISVFQGIGALIIFFGVYLTRSGYRFFQRNKEHH